MVIISSFTVPEPTAFGMVLIGAPGAPQFQLR